MTDFNQPPSDPYQPRFTQVATMMRLPLAASAAELDIAFVGVPYDLGTFFRAGAREGPSQIREMSRFLRPVHPSSKVAPFELCRVGDLGDAPVNPMNVDGTLQRITDFFGDLARQGVVPLSMGGDHTIPLPILRGLAKGGIDMPLGLIHIDAHADVLAHMDGMEVNHATFARMAIEEGLVDPGRTIQIGLRGAQWAADANRFAEDAGVRMIYQHEFDDLGVEAVIGEIRTRVEKGPTYITIDVDGLDPSCCPGTGYPEPGGLTMREVQALLRACRGMKIVGADVCEVSPPFDPRGMTALNAAHLLFELLCLAAESVATSS